MTPHQHRTLFGLAAGIGEAHKASVCHCHADLADFVNAVAVSMAIGIRAALMDPVAARELVQGMEAYGESDIPPEVLEAHVREIAQMMLKG